MNYLTYKTLTTSEKEEYDFRFRTPRPIIDITSTLHIFIIFCLTWVSMIVAVSFSSTVPELEHMTPILMNAIQVFASASLMLAFTMLFLLLFEFIRMVYTDIAEYKWRKRNSIEVIYPEWVNKVWRFLKGLVIDE